MFAQHDITRNAFMLRGTLTLLDEIEATHVGCEYGEYDE